MISYELSLGLAVIPVFLLVGNLRLTNVVRYQSKRMDDCARSSGLGKPRQWLLAIPMIISFLVFTIAVFAETNRLPLIYPKPSRNWRRLSHGILFDEVRALLPRQSTPP